MSIVVSLSKKTPFFPWHESHGATLFTKSGWVRPARYGPTSVSEHLRCRASGGIFDVHPMGKVIVRGPAAATLLDWACTNDIAGLALGAARYTCVCAEEGGIVDDVIVYRTGPERYYMMTNSVSRERVVDLLSAAADAGTWVEDVTSSVAYIAVQGPRSRDLLTAAGVQADVSAAALPYFGCVEVTMRGVPILLARTGYTGELGFELNFPAEYGLDVWDHLCRTAEPLDIRACGLEALMSLRLEKGYRFYGLDIDLSLNPVEAGLAWTVAWDKLTFSGRDALLAARTEEPTRTMRHVLGLDGCVLSPGATLIDEVGDVVGAVTSGLYGPSLDAHVGLAYVDARLPVNAEVSVQGHPGGSVRCSPRPFFDPAGERLRG